MKNTFVRITIIWICVVALLVGHGFFKYNTSGVWYGMDWDEIMEKVPECERHNTYCSWLNGAGNIVVVRVGGKAVEPMSPTVDKIRVFDASFCNPSEFRFKLIRDGMDQFQVASLVGISTSAHSSGLNRSTYITNEGTLCSFLWKVTDWDTMDYAVSGDVLIYEPSETEQAFYNSIPKTNIRHFPMLQLVPWLHNMLDGAIVWAAILYTAKLRNQHKKKVSETE